jgi:hypothetical protein
MWYKHGPRRVGEMAGFCFLLNIWKQIKFEKLRKLPKIKIILKEIYSSILSTMDNV